MSTITLRRMQVSEWDQVAHLIYHSTNAWYRAGGKSAIFTGAPTDCRIFCEVYEALDPGWCVVAVAADNPEQILGSCFVHPRPGHVSIGIVNTHPAHFGKGIARQMLAAVLAGAEAEGKPVRLVSSVMNLDSFSLYTRAGFVPRTLYQDLSLADTARLPPPDPHVRRVSAADIPALVALEKELGGLEREKDYAYFTANAAGIWSGSVYERAGRLDGYLFAVAHPASNLLGPGIARTEAVAAALLATERVRHPANPVFLVPASAAGLVRTLYRWGARNSELHVAQVYGPWTEPQGIVLPTFLPESG